MGGEVIGWRCKKHLADTKQVAMGAGVVSPFNSFQGFGSAFGSSVAFTSFITLRAKTQVTEGTMKFSASALLVLLLVPVESALCQESLWDKLMKLSPGSKMEVVDAQSGTIQGQLVSIDEQSLTLRRKEGVSETVARADVVSVTVKQPDLKKIAILAGVGSALGALAGGARCKGPTDYVATPPNGGYSTCRNPNGYYFDGTGGKIGAGAGAALGLLGFAFPTKKVLYERSLLAERKNSPSSVSGVDARELEAVRVEFLRMFPDTPSIIGAQPPQADSLVQAVPTINAARNRSYTDPKEYLKDAGAKK